MSGYIDTSAMTDFSIVEFLARLGHHPVRKIGREHFYHSMIRETQKRTPSFTVWDAGGRWIDRGASSATSKVGGGIIQLGMHYWPNLTYKEVLQKIIEVCNLDIALIPDYVPPVKYKPDPLEGEFKFELIRTQPVGSNYVLTEYLKSRGIWDVANRQLSEVYYRDKSKPNNLKGFYAVGWLNEHGNWEFANGKGFKSSIGAKGVSIVPGDPDRVAVFEGYMDYLSWLKLNLQSNPPTVIVLNAITMLSSVMERIKAFSRIDVYFDLDEPGKKCTKELIRATPHALDRSYEYSGFKDYNEKLKSVIQSSTSYYRRR